MKFASLPVLTSERRRWLGLGVVCLAQLMIVLDVTIVNVALPSIQRDLHFSQENLTWVVNAFLLTFGSLLLLAGRLGDLLGRRRIFLAGLSLFTLASLMCGVAPSQGALIAARFIQGIGAAMQASVILAIIVTQFPQAAERARAMSAYVFVSVAGGSIGLLAGGALTQALSWHWVFFVNLPIGLATALLARWLLDHDRGLGLAHGVDWLGSGLITLSLMSAVYAIVQTSTHGWGSPQVLGFAAAGIVLMLAFLAVEARIENPIMPLRILRLPGLVSGSVVRGFMVTGMYSTFFLGTLYLERVLHYSALQTGAAFLPWTLTVAVLSLGLTTRLVNRFGALRVLVFGMSMVIVGLLIMASVGPHTSFFPTFLVACLCIGLGLGTAFMPLLSIAMADVPADDAGLGSGLTNVSQQLGGALGLAVLGTVANNHTRSLLAEHHGVVSSLLGGYHLAFLIGATSVGLGITLALAVLRPAGSRTQLRIASAVEPSTDALPPTAIELERQAA